MIKGEARGPEQTEEGEREEIEGLRRVHVQSRAVSILEGQTWTFLSGGSHHSMQSADTAPGTASTSQPVTGGV